MPFAQPPASVSRRYDVLAAHRGTLGGLVKIAYSYLDCIRSEAFLSSN